MENDGAGAAMATLLTTLKRRSGLSYEQLGRSTFLSRSSVHRYCTGRSVPTTFAPVEAIATACRANREELAKLYRLWERADLGRAAAPPTPDADPDTDSITDTDSVTGPRTDTASGNYTVSGDRTGTNTSTGANTRTGNDTRTASISEGAPAGVPEPPRRRPGRKRALIGALAVALVAALVAGDRIVARSRATPPDAAPSIQAPMWTNAPRLLDPEFVGVTANSDTGKMPTFQVGSVRLWNSQTRWQNLEPARGQFDWETLERLVNGARDAGFPIVLTFGGTPAWASPDSPKSVFTDESRAGPPEDLADWDRFVRTVVTKYRGRIGAYELWDMANHPDFFTGSTATLVEMTRRASQVIRSVDPAATVVCPSMGELWDPAALGKLQEFAKRGGYSYCDAGSVKLSARTDMAPPETMLTLAQEIEKALHRHAGIELWSTGSAYDINNQPRLDEDRAARHAVRFFLSGLYAQYRRMYFYNWGSAKIPIVLQPAGGPHTKAARYVAQLDRWLTGSRIHSCGQGRTAGLPDKLWQCRFDRDGRTFLIWWTVDQRLSLPAAEGTTSVERLDGTTEQVEPGADLTVSGTPVLLRIG